MSETELSSMAFEPPYTGKDVLYRERGVSALDVQRSADALLRRGEKPSIAAIREHLGGGSPNTVGPLLEKYWKSLGTRIGAGPQALERVPESLAKMTEALWLRSIDEARERAKGATLSESATQRALADMHSKVTELTAALAESRVRHSEMEAQLLTSLRERTELKDQVRQMTAMLAAEQELRAQDRGKTETQGRELQQRREELRNLAQRRLAGRKAQNDAKKSTKNAKRAIAKRLKRKGFAGPKRKPAKRGRTRLVRQGHR